MDNDSLDGIDLKKRMFLKRAGHVLAAGAASSALLNSASLKASTNNTILNIPDIKVGHNLPAHGLAIYSKAEPLKPFKFERRALRPNDVVIDIHFCGVCHSDIHVGHGDWDDKYHPIVPGHEISGVIVAVGSAVTKFRLGDRVAVGSIVDSCGICPTCRDGLEQYCDNDALYTHGTISQQDPGGYTQGGYSNIIVVHDKFVVHIPKQIELEAAGPIMCAAVTVYSALRHWQVRNGSRIGVIGLGGLGHMAVQLASAMGAEVIVFTTSPDKTNDAHKFGAIDVVVNSLPHLMQKYTHQLDFILDTVPYQHDLNSLTRLLKHSATLCLVGIGRAKEPNQLSPFATIGKRISFAGSLIGSMREAQEVMDFCAEKNIKPSITVITAKEVNKAWGQVIAKKARYRYVIDLKSI